MTSIVHQLSPYRTLRLYVTLASHSSSLHPASPLSVFVNLDLISMWIGWILALREEQEQEWGIWVGMRMTLAIELDGTYINDFF